MGGRSLLTPQYQPDETILISVWMPCFTLTVLGFRWMYQRHDWDRLATARLIAYAMLYGAATAPVLGLIARGAVVAWLGDPDLKAAGGLSWLMYLFTMMFAEFFLSLLFVMIWCFIYASARVSRHARAAQLHRERLQDSLKEAQLSSLANQLNPHFLFNSLNNIRFMIYEDKQRADAMIGAFADILRYSLESSGQAKVALASELVIIGQYMAIVESQLERRLTFTLAIPAALERALVPPMVLQMLVENAVKHGLDQLRSGGVLALDGRRDGDTLVLQVTNDAPADGSGSAHGLGIGLRNIGQRLALLYGDAAAMQIERGSARFCVRITLPMETVA